MSPKVKTLSKKKATINSVETMEQIAQQLGDDLIPIKPKTNVTGKVLSISKSKIIVDLDGIALGLIPAKEFSPIVVDLEIGDDISAYVLMQENDEGYVILSLKRADKERYLELLEEKYKKQEPLEVWIKDANRGGLMVSFGNIDGFLPASQLGSKNYPRGDTNQILKSLKSLVGKQLTVKVITLDLKENKVIFSEKAAGDELAQALLGKFKLGDEVLGKITGIVDFGLFVNLGDVEGLIHISEIAWDRIFGAADLERRFKVGESVNAQVISNDGGRISLSIKRLLPDPWQKEAKKIKVGQEFNGTVIQVSPFGAFIKLTDNLIGLMHISEFDANNPAELKGKVKLSDTDTFQILSIEPESRKISLGYTEERRPDSAKKIARQYEDGKKKA